MSDGFDLVATVVEQMIAELPDGVEYLDTERIVEWVDQLLKPNVLQGKASQELLGLVNKVPVGTLDLGNL